MVTVLHLSILGRIEESLHVRKVVIPKEYCMFHMKSTISSEASRIIENQGASTLGPGRRGPKMVTVLHLDTIGTFWNRMEPKRFPVGSMMVPVGSLWFPVGSLLVPSWSPLVPRGTLLVPSGSNANAH